MLNLSDISDELLLARGKYATVRAAHEDSKKSLAMLCGQLSATATQILRKMQPDEDEAPESVEALIAGGRNTLSLMEACVAEIETLAKQRAELKKQAWSK